MVKESRSQVYPDYPALATVTYMDLHLWQLGFSADRFIRGPTAAYNVLKRMDADIHNGGMTSKFPIEIVPFLTSKSPGETIAPFEIMTTIGASVVPSAYLICHWVMEQSYFNVTLDVTEKASLAPLAKVIISLMHVRAMHELVQDMRDAAFKSNTGKMSAGQRPQPTILSYVHSYTRVAIDIKKSTNTRKTFRELVMDQVNQHNQHERVKRDKIKTDEISSLSNALRMSDWFCIASRSSTNFRSQQTHQCPRVSCLPSSSVALQSSASKRKRTQCGTASRSGQKKRQTPGLPTQMVDSSIRCKSRSPEARSQILLTSPRIFGT